MACGGSSHASSAAASDPRSQLTTYASCLRKHGVQVSDPNAQGQLNTPSNVDQATLQKAQQACRSSLPQLSEQAKETNREQYEKLLRYASCMRQHGIDEPDPQVTSNGGLIHPTANADTNSPQYLAAEQACSSQRPSPPSPTPSPGR
jgi:hypothetical protein